MFIITTTDVKLNPIMSSKKWKEKIPTTQNKIQNVFNKVIYKDGYFVLKGVNYRLLSNRIQDQYNTRRLRLLFEIIYTTSTWKKFISRKLNRSQLTIKEIRCYEFFSIELCVLFKELGERYDDKTYLKIANEIHQNSWLGKADSQEVPLINTSNIDHILSKDHKLLPHQEKFISLWNKLKSQLNLRGYILAFEQGLGKTLTSIALSICLNKDKIYIICPLSLTVNWANELKAAIVSYQQNQKRYMREVGIIGNSSHPVTKYTKYIICNNESLNKLLLYVDGVQENSMMIVDESQNFRNYNGTRTKQLFDVREKINPEDVLLCSGTPISASPSEIVPSLVLIDPMMTPNIAKIYNSAFNIDNILAADIINRRFGYVMYRRTKEELNLPKKYVEDLEVTIMKPESFYIVNVHNDILDLFDQYYEEIVVKNIEMKDMYMDYIDRYNNAPKTEYDLYISYIDSLNIERTKFLKNRKVVNFSELHELDQEIITNFVSKYVISNIPRNQLDEFKNLHSQFVKMRMHCMGKALGKILPARRSEMYIKMFSENKDKFFNMIENNTKKTIIFSIFVPVVEYITSCINEYSNTHAVKITGNTSDRNSVLYTFRNDQNTQVLVATSQTVGVGVTLTEANQMLFFGTPWRSSNFDQACDRIHRIGQTDDCYIYNVVLSSSAANLSTRMKNILDWSDDMFHSIINTTEDF